MHFAKDLVEFAWALQGFAWDLHGFCTGFADSMMGNKKGGVGKGQKGHLPTNRGRLLRVYGAPVTRILRAGLRTKMPAISCIGIRSELPRILQGFGQDLLGFA